MTKVVFNTVMIFNDDVKEISKNGGFNSYDEAVRTHVKMCDLLLLSLQNYTYNYRIWTNNLTLFKKLSRRDCQSKYMEIRQFETTDFFSKDIDFYASLQKLELSKLLSEELGVLNIIIDNDCVMLNDGEQLDFWIKLKTKPLLYDITSQVLPAFCFKNMLKDVNNLCADASVGTYIGGEFFGGDSDFFQNVFQMYSNLRGAFLDNYSSLTQKSDENFLSVYANLNRDYIDGGKLDIISRFWCVPTLHFPEHFNRAKESIFVHLPSSKKFLALYLDTIPTNQSFNKLDFLKTYEQYLMDRNYLFIPSFFNKNKMKFTKKLLQKLKRIIIK